MNNFKKRISIIFLVCCTFIATFGLSVATYADETSDDQCQSGADSDSDRCILYKAAMTNIWRCYMNNGIEPKFDYKTPFSDYTKIFKNTGFKQYLPVGYADTQLFFSDYSELTCYNTVRQNNGYSGVTSTNYTVGGKSFSLNYVNDAIDQVSAATSFDNLDTFLSGWGYKRQGGNGSENQAFTLTFARVSNVTDYQLFSTGEWNNKIPTTSNVLSFEVGADNKITAVKDITSKASEEYGTSCTKVAKKDSTHIKITYAKQDSSHVFDGNDQITKEVSVAGKTVEGVKQEIVNILKNADDQHRTVHFDNYASDGEADGIMTYYFHHTYSYCDEQGIICTTTESTEAEYYIDFKEGTEDDFTAEYVLGGKSNPSTSELSTLGINAVYHLSGEDSKFKTQTGLVFSKKQAAVFAENRLLNYYGGDCGKQDPANASASCVTASNSSGEETKTDAYDLVTPGSDANQAIINQYLANGYTATKWMNQNGTYSCALYKFADKRETKNSPSLELGTSGTNWYFYGYTNKTKNAEHSFTILKNVLGANTCDSYDGENNLDSSDEAKSDLDPASAHEEQAGPITGYSESEYDKAKKECEKRLTLGWLVCPIVLAATNAVDQLEEWINGFFE